MTAIPIDAIKGRAARVDIARIAVTILAFLPYALGWLAGFTVRTLSYAAAAVVVGWQDGRGERVHDSVDRTGAAHFRRSNP